MSDWLPVCFVGADERLSHELAGLIDGRYPFRLVRSLPPSGPGLLILDGRGDGETILGRAADLSEGHPERAVILMGWPGSPAAAMEAGCRGLLDYPLSREATLSLLRRLRLLVETAPAGREEPLRRTILVLGARGGVGKTLLASCLLTLHAGLRPRRRALLVDLSASSAASQDALDLVARHAVADVGGLERGVSGEAVLRACTPVAQPHQAETYFLPAARGLEDLEAILHQPELVVSALRHLTAVHDLVIVELGLPLLALTREIRREAAACLLLVPPEVPGLRQGRRWLEALGDEAEAGPPVRPVLNMGLPSRGVGPAEAKMALSREPLVMPWLPLVHDALNRGLPFSLPRRGWWAELLAFLGWLEQRDAPSA